MLALASSFASLVLTLVEYLPVTVTVYLLSPLTTVLPLATMLTVLPSESTTLPPLATLSLLTVLLPVTVQVEVESTLMVRGVLLVDLSEAEFSVMLAAPVQVLLFST